MPKLTIARKIGFGFAVLILTIVGITASVFFRVSGIVTAQDRILEEEVPTVQLGYELKGYVADALAYHRGYIIQGTEKMKAGRAQTWKKIDTTVAELDALAQFWPYEEMVDDYESFKTTLVAFRQGQQEIENVAHTTANTPATYKFLNEATPFVDSMTTALEKMIDEEVTLEPTPARKQLLVKLSYADAQLLKVTTALSTFLISGSEEDFTHFEDQLAKCQVVHEKLSAKQVLLSESQQQSFATYSEARESFHKLSREIADIRHEDNWNKAEHLCTTLVTPLGAQARELIGRVTSTAQTKMQSDSDELYTTAHNLIWIIAATGVIVAPVAIVVAFLIARSILKPISILTDSVKDLADGEGDLTRRVIEHDRDELGELGTWFNKFVHRINEVLIVVRQATNEVSAAATELSATSEELTQSMDEQNLQVSQISSAVEEMSSNVLDVATKAKETTETAQHAGQIANNGGSVINRTVDGMQSINEAVKLSSDSVEELGKRGEQISAIITVINEIADQTNLLALNAAIESARAGEHGRGFAVVADEVRKLANRTTKATEEIGSSIEAIQNETGNAVSRMTDGREEVDKGVELATEAGQSLKSIVVGTEEVTTMITAIAASTEEQSAAGEQIARSVESCSNSIAQSAEATRQSAQAISQMAEKAEELNDLVGQFKLQEA